MNQVAGLGAYIDLDLVRHFDHHILENITGSQFPRGAILHSRQAVNDALAVLLGRLDQDIHILGGADEAVEDARLCAADQVFGPGLIEQLADPQ